MRLEEATKPVFSRHETFHLRYGWLKKAYNLLLEKPDLFQQEKAPVLLGIGKNMARSIRFWGHATKMIQDYTDPESKKRPSTKPTELGNIIFDEKRGLDPYMERPETLWLLHWLLMSPPCMLPTWWTILNEISASNISTEVVVNYVISRVEEIEGWKKHSSHSIKKDVEVFIHTYSSRRGKESMEDYLDCPFRHLRMLVQNGRDEMRFVYGRKPGLSPLIVAYACLDFIDRAEIPGKTILIHRLAMEKGAPGNAFKLSETDMSEMLSEASRESKIISINNVNGLPQISFDGSARDAAMSMMYAVYGRSGTSAIKKSKVRRQGLA